MLSFRAVTSDLHGTFRTPDLLELMALTPDRPAPPSHGRYHLAWRPKGPGSDARVFDVMVSRADLVKLNSNVDRTRPYKKAKQSAKIVCPIIEKTTLDLIQDVSFSREAEKL